MCLFSQNLLHRRILLHPVFEASSEQLIPGAYVFYTYVDEIFELLSERSFPLQPPLSFYLCRGFYIYCG